MEEINEHNKNVFIRLLKDFGLELNENGEVERKNDKITRMRIICKNNE